MTFKNRIKKLEVKSGIGFKVILPVAQYLPEHLEKNDCTDAVLCWGDSDPISVARENGVDFGRFEARMAEMVRAQNPGAIILAFGAGLL